MSFDRIPRPRPPDLKWQEKEKALFAFKYSTTINHPHPVDQWSIQGFGIRAGEGGVDIFSKKTSTGERGRQ